MMTDPIANLLALIKNAIRARKEEVWIQPASKMKMEILKILKQEGFIQDFHQEEDPPGGKLKVDLKYDRDGLSVIEGLERVSKPSRRVYVGKEEIPWVRNGLGIAILSTSRGLLTDREARRKGVGGELLLMVW